MANLHACARKERVSENSDSHDFGAFDFHGYLSLRPRIWCVRAQFPQRAQTTISQHPMSRFQYRREDTTNAAIRFKDWTE